MTTTGTRSRVIWLTLVIVLSFSALSLPAVAQASVGAPKAKLGKLCTPNGAAGGQCKTPRGVAVNTTGAGGVPAGSVYVVDAGNQRIQQFSAAGTFVRAFGKEVDATTGGDICPASDVCKAGAANAEAGALSGPQGIAVDQTTGAVYVTDKGNFRVDVFSAVGVFEGAIGWKVNLTAPEEKLQFCTTTTRCQAATRGPAAGQFEELTGSQPAVEPTSGNLYVPDKQSLRLDEFAIVTNGVGNVTGATFLRAIGWKVKSSAPAEELQVCTAATGCQAGTFRNSTEASHASQFLKGSPIGLAVDANGYIYAINYTTVLLSCKASEPCGVLKFNPDGTFEESFGPASGECQLTYTDGKGPEDAAFAIAVDPSNNHVFVAKNVSETTYRVYEFDEAGTECSASPIGGLAGTKVLNNIGLALGIEGRLYANNSVTNAGEVFILGEAPPAEAKMVEVKAISGTSATFVGTVTPPAEVEGQTFDTTWHFEYSTDQDEWTTVPVPDKDAGSTPGVPVTVEESVSGLTPHTTYFVRVCATTSSTTCSPSLRFESESIAPTVIPYSAEVTQDEATLGAQINPNNLPTRYHVEWASQGEWEQDPGVYGHRLPAADRQIGAGSEVLEVGEQLSGLEPASIYHFRIITSNAAGPTVTADQEVETLDSCGLPSGRCFELVSPADKGAGGEAGKVLLLGGDMRFQAAPDGSGIAYTVANGLPDGTAGGEVLYRSLRSGSGWSSTQVSPPALALSQARGDASNPGRVRALSDGLSCGVVVSPYQLTGDTPIAVIEAGGANLYRWDQDGSYEVITNLPVTNGAAQGKIQALELGEYAVLGVSSDCDRVIFRTPYDFLGVPHAGAMEQVYEWSDGAIRNIGQVPGPTGPVVVESVAGSWAEGEFAGRQTNGGFNYVRAVSPDASSVVFGATRQVGTLSGEIGKRAVFLRTEGQTGTDISTSETATPNDGPSVYQMASWGGGTSRVFFTARYGIAANGSSSGATTCANLAGGNSGSGAGCDLYEFNVQKSEAGEAALTDLSVDTTDSEGAGVVGVLGASSDGTYVYFATRGKLGGTGNSYAENLKAGTYNVYLSHLDDPATGHREVSFVAALGEGELTGNRQEALVSTVNNWTSEVTPDGRSLLFASKANVTGYAAAGARMVYLYSADSGKTVCLSCRLDGEPSVATSVFLPLLPGKEGSNLLHPRSMLAADGDRAFFLSEDVLATGGVAGVKNLYEWRRRGESGYGQVSLLASEPVGVSEPTEARTKQGLQLAGIDAEAGDVYFSTTQRMTWQDHDNHYDVYDARIGGGFPEPSPSPAPCDATAEGACQHGAVVAPPTSSPATPGFVGPGNQQPEAKPTHKKKQHKKKQHKKKAKARRADSNRGAGK